jgi:hypothetical protein
LAAGFLAAGFLAAGFFVAHLPLVAHLPVVFFAAGFLVVFTAFFAVAIISSSIFELGGFKFWVRPTCRL